MPRTPKGPRIPRRNKKNGPTVQRYADTAPLGIAQPPHPVYVVPRQPGQEGVRSSPSSARKTPTTDCNRCHACAVPSQRGRVRVRTIRLTMMAGPRRRRRRWTHGMAQKTVWISTLLKIGSLCHMGRERPRRPGGVSPRSVRFSNSGSRRSGSSRRLPKGDSGCWGELRESRRCPLPASPIGPAGVRKLSA
jgi:hypothetical protein